MQDEIFLTGLVFFGHHGVLSEERRVGQRFVIDVDLYGDFSEAAQEDDLSKSVDYSQVFIETKKIVEGEPCNLLEALAHKICRVILQKFNRVNQVTVRVKKPNVPLQGSLQWAGVEIMRRR